MKKLIFILLLLPLSLVAQVKTNNFALRYMSSNRQVYTVTLTSMDYSQNKFQSIRAVVTENRGDIQIRITKHDLIAPTYVPLKVKSLPEIDHYEKGRQYIKRMLNQNPKQ